MYEPKSPSLEVLAPAGSIEHVAAAIAAGADAVYVGLRDFSARPNTWSLSVSEIAEAADLCHRADRRIHVAMNAELRMDRVGAVAGTIESLREAGVDALIIGDFGLLHMLRGFGSNIPVHASTLLGLYNPEGLRFVRDGFGVRRIVVNTSLYIDEIATLHFECPDVELELIAHGGICFNDNRRCRQPHYLFEGEFCVGCKQIYSVHTDPAPVRPETVTRIASQVRPPERSLPGERYIWSPEIDLSSHIALFARIGIVSFKIEGRTRTTEYVTETTQLYRDAVDAYLADPKRLDPALSRFFYFDHHSRLRARG